MKVLFISVNNEHEPYPVAPLGAAYVSSFLKKRGHEATILDLCFIEDDLKSIDSALTESKPDVIGISLRNIDNLTFNKSLYYLPRIRSIVNHIKGRSGARIVIGGSGFSIFPEEVLRYLGLDTGIIGAGEQAFASLVESINGNDRPDGIPNTCYLRDNRFIKNEVRFDQCDCLPDRSLLDNKKYLDLGGMANIQSKRGCPFHCTYCTYPSIDGSELRLREPGSVAEELLEMQNMYGIDYAFFVDDIFNFPMEHAAGICEEIIRREIRINWTCFATPMGMTAELAGLMERAGCKGVEFGSDAVTEITLNGLGKNFSPDDIADATEVCKNAGLQCAHYIIIGGPGEDSKTLEEPFIFFDKVRPTAVIALAGLRIYPNTGLHDKAIDDNVVSRETGLLEPVFYLSPALEPAHMLGRIAQGAAERQNWIVPGQNIRCDAETFRLVRKMNRRGPLWDML